MIYRNVLVYQGRFYVSDDQIQKCNLHNRLHEPQYEFNPCNINQLNNNTKEFVIHNKIVLLIHHFHWNRAHLMWDHIYPSWYGLYEHGMLSDEPFQWLTILPSNDIHVYTNKDIIEQISGSPLLTLNELNGVIIPTLITGLHDIGISHISKDTMIVCRGLSINNIDPIETFVDKVYRSYGIRRQSLANGDRANNIIYIVNKRPYNGVENLFNQLRLKYPVLNFLIVDLSKYSFRDQLNIMNNTCICIDGVGSARFNTPFLPNGAYEIQTFQPNSNRKKNIEYLDYHGGTLSRYVKVLNVPYYTSSEAMEKSYSHFLEIFIEQALTQLPCTVPVNLIDNIPTDILQIKNHNNYNNMFCRWRSSNSNIIENLIDMLH